MASLRTASFLLPQIQNPKLGRDSDRFIFEVLLAIIIYLLPKFKIQTSGALAAELSFLNFASDHYLLTTKLQN